MPSENRIFGLPVKILFLDNITGHRVSLNPLLQGYIATYMWLDVAKKDSKSPPRHNFLPLDKASVFAPGHKPQKQKGSMCPVMNFNREILIYLYL